MERKKLEEKIESFGKELTSIHQQLDLQLNQLDPSQREEYSRLMSENKQLIT